MLEMEPVTAVLDEDEYARIVATICVFMEDHGIFKKLNPDDACLLFAKILFTAMSDEDCLKKGLELTEGLGE